MGGPSNIHNPGQIVEAAGYVYASTQAIIMPIREWVNRAPRNFDQHAVDRMSKYLSAGIVDEWMSTASSRGNSVQRAVADEPNKVPTVHASAPYGENRQREWEGKLAFVFVAMGKNTCRFAKVLVEYERTNAAQSMVREALNDYSIMFSGAMLKGDAEEVFEKHNLADLRFIKVEESLGFGGRAKTDAPTEPNPDMDAHRIRHHDGKLKQVAIWC